MSRAGSGIPESFDSQVPGGIAMEIASPRIAMRNTG